MHDWTIGRLDNDVHDAVGAGRLEWTSLRCIS